MRSKHTTLKSALVAGAALVALSTQARAQATSEIVISAQAPAQPSVVVVAESPPPPPGSVSVSPIRVPSAPQLNTVILQLDSHAPSVTLYRARSGRYEPLCRTPCALQVSEGPFDFALDANGRETRVVNVGPSGTQLYVDAEAAGGIGASRPDGSLVAPTNTRLGDGSARIAASWMMATGFGVAGTSLLLAGYFGAIYAITPRSFGALPGPIGSNPTDGLLFAAIGCGVLSAAGLAVGIFGYTLSIPPSGRRPPTSISAVALLPAPNGLQLLGSF
jgi:hypothetical protein